MTTDNKSDHINRMLEMQKLLQKVKQTNEEKETKEIVQEIKEEKSIPLTEDTSESSSNLPTKYLSLNQMKLSVKEISATTSFTERLKSVPSKYDELQIEEKKAKRLINSMAKLTSGTVSVAPLKCKGQDCSFKHSCVSGDTIVSGPRDKKIRDLEIGDVVYSFNLETKLIERDVVTDKQEMGVKQLYLITTWLGNKLKITGDHKILTVNKALNKFTWATIDSGEIKKGTRLLVDDVDEYIDDDLENVGDAFIDNVISIKPIKEDIVYDITIKKNHNFFASNIALHNCSFYQENVHIVGEDCQPKGSKVLTSSHGYVNIEDLDNTVHRIVTLKPSNQVLKSGENFTLHSRHVNEEILKFSTESGKISSFTKNHYIRARWKKDKLVGKYFIYLMYAKGKYRIGQTKAIQNDNNLRPNEKVYGGLPSRCRGEKAEKAWILQVCDSKIEANLAEEFWSISTQTPKTLFLECTKGRTRAINKEWVTQSQLNDHFKRFDFSFEKYSKILDNLGLSILYPIFDINESRSYNSFNLTNFTKMRACNAIEGLIDFKIIDDYLLEDMTISTVVSIERVPYNGKVYSLNVNRFHNYITDDGIWTNNCPVETNLLQYWSEKYIHEFNVDETSITDLHAIGRLCTYDLYEMRLTRYLSENDQTLLVDFVSSVDEDGNTISNKATSAAWDTIEKIDRLRSKTLKELMATRESKAKLAQTVIDVHNNNSLSALKDKFESLINQVKTNKAEPITVNHKE